MNHFSAAQWLALTALVIYLALYVFLAPITAFAQVTFPARGGTGTSTIPSLGQVLVGQPNGTYAPQSTTSLGIVGPESTSDVPEGVNLYYTLARVQSALTAGYSAILGSATTTKATSTHLAVAGSFNFLGTVITNVSTWFSGLFDANLAVKDTDDLTEGGNQYFTEERARVSISETVSGLTYTAGSGVLSQTAGFVIPLVASTTEWASAYGWGDHATAGYLTAVATTTVRGMLSAASPIGFNASTGAFSLSTSTLGLNTSDVAEASRLYFTDARARGALSSTASGLTYNSTTGAFSLTSGFTIPTVSSTTDWSLAFSWGNHADEGYLTAISTTTVRGMLSASSPLSYDAGSGSFSLSTTGDWTGTFDGLEGSYYLANAFSTTSANAWLGTKTSDDIAEGVANLFSQWDTVAGGLNFPGGEVGINNPSPAFNLDVVGTSNVSEYQYVGYEAMNGRNFVGIFPSETSAGMDYFAEAAINAEDDTTGLSASFLINPAGGNVGIGFNGSPTEALVVGGTGKFNSAVIASTGFTDLSMAATDGCAEFITGTLVSTGSACGGSGGVAWGAITGTLSDQTDLQSELDLKVPTSRTLTAGAGLTGGGDLTADRSIALNGASIASLALADTAIQDLAGLGITATTAELNFVDGVTSAVQTQLDGKQATGSYLTALTGDIAASGPGSAAATLATVNVNTGSFGSSSAIPTFTVNGKGLITAAGTAVVVAPAGTLTGTTLASNVVSSSLTSLGMISTGVWQGSAIADPYISSAATWNAKESPLTFTYPLTRSSNTIALAFGTTTNNTWSGTNTFASLAVSGAISGATSIDATFESTIEAAIDTLASLTSIQGHVFTLTGAFIRSGAHSLTLTTTGTTNVTVPTTGTLAALGGSNTWSSTNIFSSILRLPYGTGPTVSTNGDIAVDSTSNQLKYQAGSATQVVSSRIYPAFSYATSTAWTGTTTIPLGTAYVGETWNGVQCFTNVGTVNVSFYDGTNRMNLFNASTTVGTFTLSTNNTFVAAEKRYVDIGTPASAPTRISCTVNKTITAD